MRPTIQVILAGVLPLTANGMLELRKEPPFKILTPGWAAVATVDLERDVPHIRRVFDHMAAHPTETTPVILGVKASKFITGNAHCIGREPIHRGWRYTLALARYEWSRLLRLGDVRKRLVA